MSVGAELIAAERNRQISKEGWTPEHDARHAPGEMAIAASCYALACFGLQTSFIIPVEYTDGEADPPPTWPWGCDWWKPKDRLRDLVRAGALIAAEIDRLAGLTVPEGEG